MTKKKFINFIKSEKFPDSIINYFQLYLIVDKLFSINFFGELSWFKVFLPLQIELLVEFIFSLFDNQSNKTNE